ncbi:MAG: hypothetical protein QM645_13635 [Asticcacaulis sp.]
MGDFLIAQFLIAYNPAGPANSRPEWRQNQSQTYMPLIQTTCAIVTLVCICVLLWGSGYERKGALLFGTLFGLNLFVNSYGWSGPVLTALVTDLLCLTGFIALCWKSPHPWPLWASAAQVMALMGQILHLTNPIITSATADTIQYIAIYMVLFSLFAGMIYARKPRKKISLTLSAPPRAQDNSPNIG